MIRLFVALDLPETVRERLALLQAGVPGARWTPPENFHVTLRFLGEVDEPAAEDVDAALRRVEAPSFDLALDGVGHFGTARKPQTLWADVDRSEPLRFLHDKVDRASVAAGLPPDDRKFHPHVTLGRLNAAARTDRVGRWLEDNALFRSQPIPIAAFTLYRSHLGSNGPAYEVLAEYPLTEEG